MLTLNKEFTRNIFPGSLILTNHGGTTGYMFKTFNPSDVKHVKGICIDLPPSEPLFLISINVLKDTIFCYMISSKMIGWLPIQEFDGTIELVQ